MIGDRAGVPRGLPGQLPPGERILWQGSPDAAALARTAFHTRAVALYFTALTLFGLAVAIVRGGGLIGAGVTAACGIVAVGLLRLIAEIAARGSVYTLTDRRLVLRIGMALPMSLNLPLDRVSGVALSSAGDVVLTLDQTPQLGWLALWPHARPWRLSRPEPMLRALPDAADAAERIGRACAARAPQSQSREAKVTAIRLVTPVEAIAA